MRDGGGAEAAVAANPCGRPCGNPDAMAAGCGNPRCRYNKPEDAGEKGRRYRRREEGEVSRVRHLRSILGVDRANLREQEK